MFNFDKNIYLQDFKKITALRNEIEDLVDGVMKNPIKNVYLIGIGGTLALMQPLDCMIRKYSAIPVYTVNAAELVLNPGKALGPGTFALMMSESGETKETVAAAGYCAKAGLNPVGISCKRDSSLSKAIKNCIISEEGDRYSSDGDFVRLYMIVARLLYNLGDFPQYDAFMKTLESLPEVFVKVKEECEDAAKDFAYKYKDETFHMLVGSGNCWGETYSYAMCILEEMQWIRTQSIHAAEFFHGALEIIDKDTSIILFKGEDVTRPLMDRVESFAVKYSNKVTVFDTANYAKGLIPEEFRGDLSPALITVIGGRISAHIEVARNHSLDARRYYRVVEY